jgi:L-rhamnose mutarotase
MERVCFILRIRPGAGDEYDRRHREMWPELRELIERSGMTNYTIFRQGELVIGYAECEPTFAATQSADLDAEGVGARWRAEMADLIVADGDAHPLATEVWHLD